MNILVSLLCFIVMSMSPIHVYGKYQRFESKADFIINKWCHC
jgi:hypothetical protein